MGKKYEECSILSRYLQRRQGNPVAYLDNASSDVHHDLRIPLTAIMPHSFLVKTSTKCAMNLGEIKNDLIMPRSLFVESIT